MKYIFYVLATPTMGVMLLLDPVFRSQMRYIGHKGV
jgi:hypothetical protein